MVNRKLLVALDAALIEYNIDGNAVHTPYGIVYDMSDPFNRQSERYEFENGGVCTSAESVVKELESTTAYEETH